MVCVGRSVMTWVPPSQVTGVTSAGILKQLLMRPSILALLFPSWPLSGAGWQGDWPQDAPGAPESGGARSVRPSAVFGLGPHALATTYTLDRSTHDLSGRLPSLVCTGCGPVAGFYEASRNCRD